jgi:hypothetical protein
MFRRLGVCTRSEIAAEIWARKVLRGDSQGWAPARDGGERAAIGQA